MRIILEFQDEFQKIEEEWWWIVYKWVTVLLFPFESWENTQKPFCYITLLFTRCPFYETEIQSWYEDKQAAYSELFAQK